jgi:hypothetical protein
MEVQSQANFFMPNTQNKGYLKDFGLTSGASIDQKTGQVQLMNNLWQGILPPSKLTHAVPNFKFEPKNVHPVEFSKYFFKLATERKAKHFDKTNLYENPDVPINQRHPNKKLMSGGRNIPDYIPDRSFMWTIPRIIRKEGEPVKMFIDPAEKFCPSIHPAQDMF